MDGMHRPKGVVNYIMKKPKKCKNRSKRQEKAVKMMQKLLSGAKTGGCKKPEVVISLLSSHLRQKKPAIKREVLFGMKSFNSRCCGVTHHKLTLMNDMMHERLQREV